MLEMPFSLGISSFFYTIMRQKENPKYNKGIHFEVK